MLKTHAMPLGVLTLQLLKGSITDPVFTAYISPCPKRHLVSEASGAMSLPGQPLEVPVLVLPHLQIRATALLEYRLQTSSET